MSASFALNKITKNLYLQGAESFFQYNINRHLVTVIGELHLSAYMDCQYTPSTTVAEYMVRSSKTKGDKLLLEIFPGFKEAKLIIGSKNIAEVYNNAKQQGISDSKIIGFDLRKTILNSNSQDALYHSPGELLRLSSKAVAEIYIYPLSDGAGIIEAMHPDIKNFYDGKRWIIDKNKYEYLENSYLTDIIKHCASILESLKKWDSLTMNVQADITERSNIVHSIQNLWMKVSDYQIVKHVFSLSGSDNLIIICGENHSSNLSVIFKDYKIFGQSKSASSSKGESSCINLRGSYTYLD